MLMKQTESSKPCITSTTMSQKLYTPNTITYMNTPFPKCMCKNNTYNSILKNGTLIGARTPAKWAP